MRTGTETVYPCTCYHFDNSENVKKIHRGVLFSVKLNNETCDFTKRTLLHVFFFTFFKLYNWYQNVQSVSHLYDADYT